jgi:hypothetical protein
MHDNNTEQATETFLSSQTAALRKSLEECRNGIERLRKAQDDGIVTSFANDGIVCELIRKALAAAGKRREVRQDGINELRKRIGVSSESRVCPIDILHLDNSNAFVLDDEETIQTFEFKQKYCSRNVPCIIRGLDQTSFANVSSQWRSELNIINAEWFINHLGGDIKVPVRVDATNNSNGKKHDTGLDEDGRAVECETVEMELGEWIEYCKQANRSTVVHSCNTNGFASIRYLKDWHLLQFL